MILARLLRRKIALMLISIFVLSSGLLSTGEQSQAHETQPAIVDVTVLAFKLTLIIDIAIEPLLAGLDLSDLTDTADSPLASLHDQMRALEPDKLRQVFDQTWPDLAKGFTLSAGSEILLPQIDSILFEPVGDVELPRQSLITVTAVLPENNAPVTIGWQSAFGPMVIRQHVGDEIAYTAFLTNGQTSDPLPRGQAASQSTAQFFAAYIVTGFKHILPLGLDHILFVLGIFLFSTALRPLVLQITTFTIAHTVTLAAATLGLTSVPSSIVEPLIALSIAYIAFENIRSTTFSSRRLVVIFGFGLLHGLGFASMLLDIGLDPAQFVIGLIAFNIGVELGQLTIVAAAILTVGIWFGKKEYYRRVIAIPGSVAIGLMGLWWAIERVFL